jgi:alpha-galactosidase
MRRIFSLAMLFAASACAADLTGNWLVKQESPDGNVRETYFDLKQDGTNVTGSMRSVSFDRKIQSGTIDADGKVLLTMQGQNNRPGQRIQAMFVNGELRVTMTGRGTTEDITAARAPAGAGGPPERIPPPELHKVSYNGLARTPPMGWNSWNKFAGRVTAEDVKGMADAIVSSGMRTAGYIYINIDDTWEGMRDANGNITSNKKFPDMKGLADYVHSKALKLGIYSSPGPKTCAGYEGSYGHEMQDAKTWAAWGIDYLKYDWCSAGRIYKDEDMQAVYQIMGDALEKTGRKIVFSLCQYGKSDVWKWGPDVGGNLWRTTGDISDHWESMTKIGFGQDKIAEFAAPGHWNDPDMLEIGNGGMTNDEYKVHMSLWSLLSAPLLAGNDVRTAKPEIMAILTNPEVIRIDQDTAGHQATRVSVNGDQEVWMKQLADGGKAIGLFNRGAKAAEITVKWPDVGVAGSQKKVRDLWAHTDVNWDSEGITTTVPSHGVALIRVSK